MRTRILPFSFVVVLLALSANAAFGADLFSGTWTLNISKTTASHFTTHNIEKIVADDNGLKVIADPLTAGAHVEYAVKFDGKDYPYAAISDGKPNADVPDITYSAKKIDAYTIEFTIKIKDLARMRIIGTEIMTVSKDGKTRTVTRQFRDAEPQVIVWDKL